MNYSFSFVEYVNKALLPNIFSPFRGSNIATKLRIRALVLMRGICYSCALAVICISTAFATTPSNSTLTTVAVVSTLHQFHKSVPGYGFDELRRIIEALRPDILAVELTAKDLADRTPQPVKQEYQQAVFPLLLQRRIQTIPLEPDEPRYSKLVALSRSSESKLVESRPEAGAAFSLYVNELQAYLFARWTSPCAVNSAETDALYAVKHMYQNALFGRKEQAFWERWNQHALDQIIRAMRSNPGKRIVVLMGVEHGYWLRSRLAEVDGVRLLPSCSFLERAS